MKLRLLCVAASLLCVGLLPHTAQAAFVSNWQASSGFPDQSNPPYTLFDNASETPMLGGSLLTLSTDLIGENMHYRQTEPLIDPPSAFYIETRMRVVSGTTNNIARTAAGVLFTTDTNVGNTLYIGNDEIFLLTDNNTRGTPATVDTNDFLHTYRIEVTGGTGIKVFQDNVQKLTGTTFNDFSANGSLKRVLFGEASTLAFGTSEWQYVTHNGLAAAPIPEPSSMMLMSLGLLGLWGWQRRKISKRAAAA